MTLPEITKLSARNLTRSKRRSVILGIAIAFGFFIVTTIDGLVGGAVDNLEDMITQMVGGTVAVTGYEKPADLNPADSKKDKVVNIIRDHDFLQEMTDSLGIDYKYSSRYTRTSGQLIFNGKKVVASVYGRDFANDKALLDSFQIKEGDFANLSDPKALVIGEACARTLKVEVGDEVLVTASTIYDQVEVGEFKIALIVKDTNFISGLITYADIEAVNELIGIPRGGFNFYSIYLKNNNQQSKAAFALQDAISEANVPVTDLRQARKDNPNNPENAIVKQLTGKEYKWDGVKYAVEGLDDGVPQLKTIMFYVNLVSTIILIVILLITMVGISNTYRMVLYERIREIGTMRALGMTRKDTKRSFRMEAVILSLLSGVIGLVLSIIVMMLLGIIHIENESVQMFLKAGHMTFSLSPVSIILQYLLMMLLTMLAVNGTAKRAARMSPAQALRTVK
ncbi:MAG: FtsX-like permease family protein [Treponema sp.]|nr:FtsX-like permease family protein [Treponema sp.]